MSYTLLEIPSIAKELAREIDNIPGVVQVRVNPVIRKSIRDITGEDGLTFMAMVEQNGAHDLFVPIAVFLPQVVYGNRSSHKSVVESMTQKIKEYRDQGYVDHGVVKIGKQPSIELISE